MVAHEGVQTRMHPEHRRMAIRRRNAHALHLGQKPVLGVVKALSVCRIVRGLVDNALQDAAVVRNRDERDERRRLLRIAGRIAAHVEAASGQRTKIAVAGAVHVPARAPRLAPALGLRDDRRDVASRRVAQRRHNRCVQAHPHTGLRAHLLAHELHVLRLVDEGAAMVLRAAHVTRAVLVQPRQDLAVEIGAVESDEARKQSARPDAAERAVRLYERHLRPTPCGGNGRGDAGRATARHQHVAFAGDRQIARLFADATRSGLRRRKSLDRRQKRRCGYRAAKECSSCNHLIPLSGKLIVGS